MLHLKEKTSSLSVNEDCLHIVASDTDALSRALFSVHKAMLPLARVYTHTHTHVYSLATMLYVKI